LISVNGKLIVSFPEAFALCSKSLNITSHLLLFFFEHLSSLLLLFAETFEQEFSTLSRQFSHCFKVDKLIIVVFRPLLQEFFAKVCDFFFVFTIGSVLLAVQFFCDDGSIFEDVFP
jgi:hypothetical protein